MAHPVGRNDPCPCGSGKKHKKCCLHAGGTASAQVASPHEADDETGLPLCSDRYLPCAEPRDDAVIAAALDSIPGADRMVEDDPGTTGWHFEEVGAPGGGGRLSHFATAALNAEALVVLAASEDDLDLMRKRVEAAVGGIIRYESRRITTPEDLDRLMEENPPTEEDMEEPLWSPGEARLFLDHKAAYYAQWPHEPQPYLDGLTPIAAMAIPRFRRHIEGILEDMEEREALVHSAIRIDLAGLRRELGIEDLQA